MEKKFYRNIGLKNDLFVCDIQDVIFKNEMEDMSHPFYALSTKPSQETFLYEAANGGFLKISPSDKGMATLHDKDILIYCISYAMAEYNKTGNIPKTIEFNFYDALKMTGRGTSGRSYAALKDALHRLRGTSVTTCIKNGDEEITTGEGLISNWKIRNKTSTGKVLSSSVTLSNWTIEGIKNKKVKTIHKDYFLLRRPIDKRIYEIVKKHIGSNSIWEIGIDKLKDKTGSGSSRGEFGRLIEASLKSNHLPEFLMAYKSDKKDILVFSRREDNLAVNSPNDLQLFSTDVYEKAKKVAPNYDVYWLEQEWHQFWVDTGKIDIKNPEAAFIAFCKRRYEQNPNPQNANLF